MSKDTLAPIENVHQLRQELAHHYKDDDFLQKADHGRTRTPEPPENIRVERPLANRDMTIDAHIHLYPASVYENARSWAEKWEEPYWLQCVSPSSGPTLQGWASVDQLLRDMDAAEIKQAIILGWYWENANTCYENTSWQRDWIARHPDRLMAFAPFNANGGAASIDALKQAFESGFSGIGELNPPAQGYTYENETLDLAIALAGEYNVPVNFHVTDPTGHDYPGKIETPIDSLIALAKSHAETTFIFAHLAGMMELPQLKTLKNVYLDTAAVPLLYPARHLSNRNRIHRERSHPVWERLPPSDIPADAAQTGF